MRCRSDHRSASRSPTAPIWLEKRDRLRDDKKNRNGLWPNRSRAPAGVAEDMGDCVAERLQLVNGDQMNAQQHCAARDPCP
ncbi:hypothetical protein AB7M43_008159 [Bradyrhizobium elkanii]